MYPMTLALGKASTDNIQSD